MAARAGRRGPAEVRAFYRQLREDLTECARQEFELQARQGDGATRRQHLQRRAKNTGEVDETLKVRWPREGDAIWRVFNKLGRQYTLGGPLPIAMVEIDAYERVHGIRFTAWELEMIQVFDALRIEYAAKHRPKPGKKKQGA